jgi:hypothetical protein
MSRAAIPTDSLICFAPQDSDAGLSLFTEIASKIALGNRSGLQSDSVVKVDRET